ncbi:DNA polymerase III subunit gamma/tau [Candidatus Methylopumilus universalis]|uniref:DNA polymerase III subunit gamma/tau n=1 Tax=Candidatus Methylopumilus universalis TaxID=2588536 RepID=A0AAX1EZM0_9PROT|nr:DNA polymerase III subunit gamma/tau [Candidatus Methylopumilus universalis]QDC41200.1 DNA polymerase III subunit gamma/tau [Candidatus Methylopumilus universalis]QDC42490.1 DNA polymerase III subunit gamma/tau [Candidatus Methylopumilus universalis]QDC54876.1 DNA polymerase III subunit gamma/tau [Candidatus Methylopumilus universalis]QDC56157.1 DNA polymerase III subunit gamma/tau [Candidatus Methylopumilus universalis]QDC57439.1 DNA polymerase III subunit gamma/tau [Candidatus Methylopumi
MSYQVLARKYRPRSFDTLVGQAHVVQALKNALDQKRLHHAYLFTGTRGVGKTTLARILAKALNCENGISSSPCGTCSACTEIDQGRYVDLIEVDAASNTQVDNMRDLLDNAQYAPTQGQFKIYIIDEVHMLSKSAFNAMLKTLEEPPEHVKFILATTDPQKVPVTVLSRCLQFNLKQMPSASISEYMEKILKEEAIHYEINAIYLIAKAANGSMRDALSILDQGIAYCGGTIEEATIKKMLGAIDQSYLFNLIQAVIDQDGQKVIEIAKHMDERNLSFEAALNDLANLIQIISVTQAIPESLEVSYLDRDQVIALSKKISAEQLQLLYQITILGRRDLYLAPDEYAGFTMTLLRMLSFAPQDAVIAKNPAIAKNDVAHSATKMESAAISKDVSSETFEIKKKIEVTHEIDEDISDKEISKEAVPFNGNWRELVDQLKLGLVKALAQQSELVSFKNNEIILSIADEHKHLLNEAYQKKLELSLSEHFSQRIKLIILQKGANNSPLKQKQEERSTLMKDTENAILQDQFVKSLLTEFNAEIIPSSIKPNQTT